MAHLDCGDGSFGSAATAAWKPLARFEPCASWAGVELQGRIGAAVFIDFGHGRHGLRLTVPACASVDVRVHHQVVGLTPSLGSPPAPQAPCEPPVFE